MIAGSSLDKFHFQSDSIQDLIIFLRKSTNINLECYKDRFLKRRITFRMNRLKIYSNREYMKYLLKNPLEFNEFKSEFTVNYTYFFRNYEIYKGLMWYLLNNQIRQGRYNTLKIWSAPCSSGEEPYSLALLLDFMKKNCKKFPNQKVEIVASDIDRVALENAKNAIYKSYSLHELPPLYASYFTESNHKYEKKYYLREDIKEKVRFIEEDVTEGHALNQKYDIIFCRNLLIYLNKPSQERVLKTISEHLNPQGLLVTGLTEMIHESPFSNFKLINPKLHFYSYTPK